jgi:hypothetical protein
MSTDAAAEKALRERERVWRHYRAQVRVHRNTLYRDHPQGPELHAFARQLQRFKIEQAAAFLIYVKEQNRQWLCTAPPEIRAEALSLVDDRIQRLRLGAGMLSIDDPLPEEEDDVFQACKQELT